MINFEYIRSSTAQAAIAAAIKNTNTAFIAGGTNLVDLMKKGVTAPQRLIDINNLPLKAITEQGNTISIGALAHNSDVAENTLIQKKLPLLAMALSAGASPQLRNMATVGGNMLQRTRCSYFYDTTMPCNKRQADSGCGAAEGYNRMHALFGSSTSCVAVHPSDMCVALAALNATVHVAGIKAEKKIPFADFHRLPGNTPQVDTNLQPGELITSVSIPINAFTHYYYLKIRDRASYAFALVSVAVALQLSGNTIQKASIAMGGVAHKPWRLTAVEAYLVGKHISTEVFAAAGQLAMQGATPLAHNSFKIKLGSAAVQEALEKATS